MSNAGMHPIEELSGEDVSKKESNQTVEESDSSGTLHQKLTEIKSKKRSIARDEESDDSDTDLEIEEESKPYDISGKNAYFTACKSLGVIPASYVVRHIGDAVLNLGHHGLGAMGVKALSIPLVNNTTVNILDLQDNWLEGEGGEYLSEMLTENCYITDLNIADNKLGRRGMVAICKMLKINITLELLDLSGNELGDTEGEMLADVFSENNHLQVLKLSHNNLGEKGVQRLADAIAENDRLEELDLSWNNFRLKSAVQICSGIMMSSGLRRVSLAMNGLANEGAFAVGEILKQSNSLTDLDISYNRIGVPGATVIAKQLENNVVLKVLKIGHNPLGPEGAGIILKGVAVNNKGLTELDLSGIEVDKEFKSKEEEVTSARNIKIKHGPVLSDYVIKIKPKKKPSQLFSTAIEELTRSNILEVLKTYCEINDINLSGHLDSLDKDYRLTWTELLVVFTNVGIELNGPQKDLLEGLLSDYRSGDGKLDLSALQ